MQNNHLTNHQLTKKNYQRHITIFGLKYISFFMICLFLSVSILYAQEKVVPVVVDGDEVTYLHEENKVIAHGNVSLRYKDIIIKCDEALYYAKENKAQLKGNIEIISPEGLVYADEAVYDFTKRRIEMQNISVKDPPHYGKAMKGEGIVKEKYILEGGYVTTCDLDEPHYRIRAKRIFIYPQDKVVAKNVVIVVGDIPLMYLPYYSQRINDSSFPVELSPGKSSEWGVYLLSRWRYNPGEDCRGKVLLDVYEKRGIGAGVTHKTETSSYGEGLFNAYFIEDELYGADKRDLLFNEYPDRINILPKYLKENRYKTQFSYSWQPRPTLSVKSEFHKFSDEYFMKDFFFREYEIEPHPLSYLLADKTFTNSSLTLLAQKRANHFFSETEYLPKLEYNLYRQALSETAPFYIESKISLANLTLKRGHSASDDDAERLYSDNELSYDKRIGWLNVNPYIGFISAFYSKNAFGDSNIIRNAPKTGVTLSTDFYKIFRCPFSFWGEEVSKFRHILTPELTYSYIHSPTVSNAHVFQFDSNDDLARKESIIFKLENKLQAKSDSRNWDFLYFSPSIEYKIDEEVRGSYFDIFKMDLEMYPTQYVSLAADSNYDCQSRVFTEANVDVNLKGREDRYSIGVGHRYARGESSQNTVSSSFQLTPKWKFTSYLRYEFKQNEFKEQQYVLRRDLHCWWMDVGLNVDDDRNFGIWFMFTVKAYPKAFLGFHHTYQGARRTYKE